MTADGEPSQLCLDFELLTEQRMQDVELTLPFRRGEVAVAVLDRNGARARVPLFAPKLLKVTFRAPHYVTARWKGEGPLQRVPIRASVPDGVTFDLSTPPHGATLLLRVAVGCRRLREVPSDEGTSVTALMVINRCAVILRAIKV
jgi:hypothetical protein